jgi:hypothetical protein
MGMWARSSRRCHTSEWKTGLDARNHAVSGAGPATGPELPERVQQVRAALSDADRARFEQELDLARSTRIWGRSAMSSRVGGGWCSLVSTLTSGGRRPRRGCATVTSLSGKVSRWTWRTRSAAISPELFPGSVRRHGAAAIGYHQRRCRRTSVRCVGSFTSI